MNQEQVLSIVRQMLLVAGGSLVTKGYVDAGTLNAVIGALLVIVGAGWAIYTRRNTGLVQSASNVPSVTKIVTTDSEIARSDVTNGKVTL